MLPTGTMRICTVAGCDRPHSARGWCRVHYYRWYHDRPLDTPVRPVHRGTVQERFWQKVNRNSAAGCWLFLAGKDKDGYGKFKADGRHVRAHRYAYEILVGPIPDGLEPDHLCRTPACVNPAHLELVTPRENTLRGSGPTAVNARKTHCKHGHAFTPMNTRLEPRNKDGPLRRYCRTCDAARQRAYYAAKSQ